MSRLALSCAFFAALMTFATATPAAAGMPAPLPRDYEQVTRLTDSAHERLQAISFFLVGLLVASGAVQFLWNFLRRDFANLPRLSYGKALCGVVLWGLLSFVVLTMISGARELMTPGAWQKQGATYRLTSDAHAAADPSWLERRRQTIEDLRTAVWRFAALNGGRFPEGPEDEAVEDSSVAFFHGSPCSGRVSPSPRSPSDCC